MATVAQKKGTVGSFIDDLAGMLDGLSAWSDADPAITNSGETGRWEDNGRVYQNSNTGQYVLFYVFSENVVPAGIRFVVSTDWDSKLNHPAGYTNCYGRDPFSGDVKFHRDNSFKNRETTNEHSCLCVTIIDGNNSGLNRDTSATYFMSANNHYIAACGWNTVDGNHGTSGYMVYEHVDNKFWDDGQDPFYAHASQNYHSGCRNATMYGWSTLAADEMGGRQSVAAGQGFYDGNFGLINPDSNDDTFFFRRPVLFERDHENNPVAYSTAAVTNDTDQGAAHGDSVSINGTNYQSFRQGGASLQGSPVSALLRYE